jgi:hypothetical protein
MAKLTVGSESHKELFCRDFIACYQPYEPEQLLAD